MLVSPPPFPFFVTAVALIWASSRKSHTPDTQLVQLGCIVGLMEIACLFVLYARGLTLYLGFLHTPVSVCEDGLHCCTAEESQMDGKDHTWHVGWCQTNSFMSAKQVLCHWTTSLCLFNFISAYKLQSGIIFLKSTKFMLYKYWGIFTF